MELELVFKEEKKDVISEWDKTVPILSRGKTVIAYLNDEIYEDIGTYNELCFTLENTTADHVKLVLNNGGGAMNTMLTIVNSIRKCKATVTAVISGNVSSAATMITLACDEIEVAPNTSWLTHYYSGGSSGKGNELEAKYEFYKVYIPKMFKDIHKGFLTTQEINKVIQGKDMWMETDEILARFAKMKELR